MAMHTHGYPKEEALSSAVVYSSILNEGRQFGVHDAASI
jgi:hypothetical protein